MKIYEVNFSDEYDVCGIDFEACRLISKVERYDMYFNFDGSSKEKSWWPRIMERLNEAPKLGDYISHLDGDVIILEKKAIDKLKPIMGNIEILPLKCPFGDYWAINVLDVLKCIDYEKSEFDLLSDELEDGRPDIMCFSKYEFIKEKIQGYNIFKIIDKPGSAIFVNDTFVDEVKKHGITGFQFDLVWQDEKPDETKVPVIDSKKDINMGQQQEAMVTPLEDEVIQELHRLELKAYKLIGAKEKDTPTQIVTFMCNYVDKLLYKRLKRKEIDNISIALAAAWGLAVCKEYNWEWQYLEVPGKTERSYYILSHDHWYCCPPFYFIANILEGNNKGLDGKNDNTVLLLFNMIKTLGGKVPDEKYYIIC